MARMHGNAVMKNVSGIFAKQVVFKTRNGKQYVSGPPVRQKPFTENQLAHQDRFGDRSKYASILAKSEEFADVYRALRTQKHSPYHIALRDIRIHPEITAVHTKSYTGKINDVIVIQAVDDVMVKKVEVQIFNADNELIEGGIAVQSDDKLVWSYAAAAVLENIAGSKVVIKAFDIPENETIKEITL